MYSSNTFLFMLQMHIGAFSPHRPREHNPRQVYQDDHGYDAEGGFMEETPAKECSYIYLVGDFSFGRLPEDEQLLVVPFVMRSLLMAVLKSAPLEDEDITEIRLRYSGYREEASCDSCLTYTSRYFSLYVRPGIVVENPFRTAKSVAELGEENVLGLISRSLSIVGRVVYPPRDEVLCSLQVPTGDPDTDHHMRSMIKSTGNLAI